jgi:hypothetical protein
VIDALDPDIVTAGTPPPIMLKMRGDRLGKVSTVRLNADERRPNTVGEHELTLTLRPEDVAHPREITVTAVTPDGGVSPAVKLHVLSPLSIVMPDAAALPDATVGVSVPAGTQGIRWPGSLPMVDRAGTGVATARRADWDAEWHADHARRHRGVRDGLG